MQPGIPCQKQVGEQDEEEEEGEQLLSPGPSSYLMPYTPKPTLSLLGPRASPPLSLAGLGLVQPNSLCPDTTTSPIHTPQGPDPGGTRPHSTLPSLNPCHNPGYSTSLPSVACSAMPSGATPAPPAMAVAMQQQGALHPPRPPTATISRAPHLSAPPPQVHDGLSPYIEAGSSTEARKTSKTRWKNSGSSALPRQLHHSLYMVMHQSAL